MKILSMKGLVETAHGKICQDDNNSVSYRKKDGLMYSARRCHKRNLKENPYTDQEKKIQTDFTSLSKIAAAWTKANRVYKNKSRAIDLDACTADYRKMRAAFDAQSKIVTFQAFVWAQIQDGAVVVPDVSIEDDAAGGAGGGSKNDF